MAKGYFPTEKASTERNNNNSSESPSMIARAGLNLPLNQMALPIYSSPPPTREDVETGGRVLFQRFLEEEFESEGLPPPNPIEVDNALPNEYGDAGADNTAYAEAYVQTELPASYSAASTPDGFPNRNLMTLGEKLRALSDEFRHSRQGQEMNREVDELELSSITGEAFIEMLNVFFSSGVNEYRIVAVFNFCCRLLIRCFKEELKDLGIRIFFWALRYIQQKVCKWVYENGGWERVLTRVYHFTKEIIIMAAIGLVVVSSAIYIKKNLLN